MLSIIIEYKYIKSMQDGVTDFKYFLLYKVKDIINPLTPVC